MTRQSLTAERVRDLLRYDSNTGIFRWRISRSIVKAGDVAGSIKKNGYRLIQVDGHLYLNSRLAWLYIYGHWPQSWIDHKNGITDDNRLSNLRDVTQSENMQNRRVANRNNRTTFLGVSHCFGKFRAQIEVNGKNSHLGLFPTPEAAHMAYLAAKRELHSGGLL